jgi:hypothetical protein
MAFAVGSSLVLGLAAELHLTIVERGKRVNTGASTYAPSNAVTASRETGSPVLIADIRKTTGC